MALELLPLRIGWIEPHRRMAAVVERGLPQDVDPLVQGLVNRDTGLAMVDQFASVPDHQA
ncbi:hypothetical protein HOK31_20495 [Candidatus Poribacteria bacterium]|nr:hypothetical protein [Candidatus Poribacteria bacterium]